MKVFFFPIFSSFILAFSLASAEMCPEKPTAPGSANNEAINIKSSISALTIHTDVGVSMFNDVASDSEIHGSHLVMGFTRGGTELSSGFTMSFSQLPSGKFCLWADSVNAKFRLTPLEVYIPNDFVEGSCEFAQVKKHELEHVEIYKRTFAEYVPKLKSMLERNPLFNSRSDALLVSSQSEGKSILKGELSSVLQTFRSQFDSVLNQRQSSIDTPENYKAIAAKCDSWGKKFVDDLLTK